MTHNLDIFMSVKKIGIKRVNHVKSRRSNTFFVFLNICYMFICFICANIVILNLHFLDLLL